MSLSEFEPSQLPNCSKFAVKCEYNSKISKNVRSLGFFEKKKQTISEFVKGGNFVVDFIQNDIKKLFLKNVFRIKLSFFEKKSEFFKVGKIEKFVEESVCIKRSAFSLLKSIFVNTGGRKISR